MAGEAVRVGGGTTPAAAKRVVLFALVVSGGAVAAYDLKKGHMPSLRLGVGLLFGAVLLSAFADVVPEVAAPLGMLMVVGVMLTPQRGGTSPGQELIRSVSGIVNRKGT